MYRVYDNKRKCWMHDEIYLAPNDELYFVKKRKWFGLASLTKVSQNRYVWQKEIGLRDKNKIMIFEGDICKVESYGVVGLVAYTNESAAYYLFDHKNGVCYPLDKTICNQMVIIGNVFNNDKLLMESNEDLKDDNKEDS